MPLVRIKTGADKGKSVEILDEPVVIGREASDGLRILDQGASRRHAEIFKIGEMYFIRDLDSKNGTFVNDDRIMEELLQFGDKIKIGTTVFVFEEEGLSQDRPPMDEIQFSSMEQLEATMEIDLRSAGRKTDLPSDEPRSVQTLKTLYELGNALGAEEDERSLMNRVLQFSVSALDADAGYVFTRDGAGKLMAMAIYEKQPGEGRKISRSIIKRVFRSSKAVMTSDAAQDARFKDRQSVVIRRIQSVICVPLMAIGKVKGVLYLHGSGLELAFSEEDFELATFIGIQAGNALESLQASMQHRRILMSAIKTFVAIGELRHPKTQGHSERVCVYSAAIANEMALPPEVCRNLQVASLLHDIGKIVKGERTLLLEMEDAQEEGEVQEEDHVLHGERIIENMEGMEHVLPGIRHHHENYDGTGYPDALEGERIPLLARVIRVADAFDHLLHDGESEKPRGIKEAVVAVGKNAQGLLDPHVTQAMVRAYRSGTLFTPEKLLLEEYFEP